MKYNRQNINKVLLKSLFESDKIEVKDNNIEQALRVLKRNSKEMDFLKL